MIFPFGEAFFSTQLQDSGMFGPFVVRISRIVLGSEHFWVPVGGGAGGSPRDRILQGIEREGRKRELLNSGFLQQRSLSVPRIFLI